MKKISLAKRNALLSVQSVSWGACAFVGVVFLLIVRLAAPNLFLQIISPFLYLSDAVAQKSHIFITSFSNTTKLVRQNEMLLSENVRLASENQMLLQKTDTLSALFENARSQKYETGILAGVVARPPESPYDTLVLAVGEKEGAMPGQEVFGEGNVPIGIVSSVSADFTRVTLFSAPDATLRGWVREKDIPITIVGKGGGVMSASVARAAGVTVGDIVFAPGPGMLPIGSVVRVDSDASSPSVVLHIAPARNLFSLTWVELRTTGVLTNIFVPATTI